MSDVHVWLGEDARLADRELLLLGQVVDQAALVAGHVHERASDVLSGAVPSNLPLGAACRAFSPAASF